LFKGLSFSKVSFVGSHTDSTNTVSTVLMDFAGNPYRTYDQEEHCPWCNNKLKRPTQLTLAQKIATKLVIVVSDIQRVFSRPRANWIHLRFEKNVPEPTDAEGGKGVNSSGLLRAEQQVEPLLSAGLALVREVLK